MCITIRTHEDACFHEYFICFLWSCVRIQGFLFCRDELIWREGNFNRAAEASGTANKASAASYAQCAPSRLIRRETIPRQHLQKANWQSIISLTDIYLPHLYALWLLCSSGFSLISTTGNYKVLWLHYNMHGFMFCISRPHYFLNNIPWNISGFSIKRSRLKAQTEILLKLWMFELQMFIL